MASILWRATLLSHGHKPVGSSESSSMDFSSLEGARLWLHCVIETAVLTAVPTGRKLPVTGRMQVAAYLREDSC